MTDQVARSTYENKQDEVRKVLRATGVQIEEELYNVIELVLFSDLN